FCAGIDDGLSQFHVVYVECADGETAVVGEIEHRFGGHQRHGNFSSRSGGGLVEINTAIVGPPEADILYLRYKFESARPPADSGPKTAQQFRGQKGHFQMAEPARNSSGNICINRLRAMISSRPA